MLCSTLEQYQYKKQENGESISRDCMLRLRKTLIEASETIENVYYLIRQEMESELLGVKHERQKIDNETHEVYDRLSFESCAELVKKKMPRRISLFSKITCNSMAIRANGRILMHCYFGNDSSHDFECDLHIDEIKRLMRWK